MFVPLWIAIVPGTAAAIMLISYLRTRRIPISQSGPVIDLGREDLIREVRARSEATGIDIPTQVFGHQPSVVIHEPSRRVHYVYEDRKSMILAIDDQQVTTKNSSVGERPRPVESWSSAQLRRWLHQHRLEEPEARRPSTIRRLLVG